MALAERFFDRLKKFTWYADDPTFKVAIHSQNSTLLQRCRNSSADTVTSDTVAMVYTIFADEVEHVDLMVSELLEHFLGSWLVGGRNLYHQITPGENPYSSLSP